MTIDENKDCWTNYGWERAATNGLDPAEGDRRGKILMGFS